MKSDRWLLEKIIEEKTEIDNEEFLRRNKLRSIIGCQWTKQLKKKLSILSNCYPSVTGKTLVSGIVAMVMGCIGG